MGTSEPTTLPDETAELFSVPADQFVSERARVVKELRGSGRREEAALVAKLRKPPRVVLDVNRAARALPRQARAAARASEKLVEAQARGSRSQLERSQAELQAAVEALVDRAAAESSTDRTSAHQLVRAAVATEDGRRALETGMLRDVVESRGFDALAGVQISAPRREAARAKPTVDESRRAAEAKRRRELEAQLAAAREGVREAKRAELQARRELDAAERAVRSLEQAFERLQKRARA
jgi:hypothetical protein